MLGRWSGVWRPRVEASSASALGWLRDPALRPLRAVREELAERPSEKPQMLNPKSRKRGPGPSREGGLPERTSRGAPHGARPSSPEGRTASERVRSYLQE